MESKTEFDRLMREAVAIKSAQLSQYRKKFDLWPQFHQAGLYYCDSFKSIRESSISDKLSFYETKRQECGALFASCEYQQALHKYEETLTLFRWVTNRNEKWRNSGIEDDDLTIEFTEKTDETISAMVNLYLNIALCNIKLQIWKEAVAACDEALALDDSNIKALYRKSIALTLPAGSDLDDYRTAIKLLSKAAKLDPHNTSVRQKLSEFQIFLKNQKAKSKETFHSFFKKSTYEDAKPEKSKNSVKEYDELIEKGEFMVKDLKSHGKKQEARKLEKNVKLMKQYKDKALDEAKKKAMDFDNPTEDMKKHAKEYGLDLDDPVIKAELNRMKQKGVKYNEDYEEEDEEQQTEVEGAKKKVQEYKKKIQADKQKGWFSLKWSVVWFAIILIALYVYSPTQSELW